MTEAERIMAILRDHLPALREQFHIKSLGLFGSYVRGEQQEGSDVDLLVEFDRSVSLLQFMAAESHLADLLGRKVDLVMKSALKPRIGKRILRMTTCL